MHPTISPPARGQACMAYDVATQQVVLFGGEDDSSLPALGDIWLWDGTNWTQQYPSTSPSAREDASMAYDPVTQNIVLFGGGVPHIANPSLNATRPSPAQ